MRFIVTAAFAWTLIRATFANTAVWRHPQTLVSASAHREYARKSPAAQRLVNRQGRRALIN